MNHQTLTAKHHDIIVVVVPDAMELEACELEDFFCCFPELEEELEEEEDAPLLG